MIVIDTITWKEFFSIQTEFHPSWVESESESLYSRHDFDVNDYLIRLDGEIIHGSIQIGLSRKTIELIEDKWYFDAIHKMNDTSNVMANAEIVIVKSPVFSDLGDSYHHIVVTNCFVCLRASKSISSGEQIVIETLPSPPKNNLRSGIVSTIENGVIVHPSSIPNAGLGLFAYRDFEKNEPITLYDGKIIDRKEASKLKAGGKATHIGLFLLTKLIIILLFGLNSLSFFSFD